MNGKYWYIASGIVAVSALLVSGRYVTHARPGQEASAAQDAGAIARPILDNSRFHMPTSAGKVRTTSWIKPGGEPTASSIIFTRLTIDRGWHVNANPASLPFLIPTEEAARINGKPAKLDVVYPQGRNSDVVLQGTAIRVYDDGTTLKASIAPQTLNRLTSDETLTLEVTVQSCSNKGICLPPATLSSKLP